MFKPTSEALRAKKNQFLAGRSFPAHRVKMCTSPIPLLVSTRNSHKLCEIRTILGAGFEVSDLSILPTMSEVEETGTSFEANAELKALGASQLFEGWVIADDSGLEVDALGGAPGVYSARYAGKAAGDSENNALLLKNLGEVPEEERRARFRCVIVLARAGRKLAAFNGFVEGLIALSPRGGGGFGYDPLFVPNGFSQTFGELPVATKNRLSHRAHALSQLRAWGGWC
jgi:XTP/dITP diphosphohydrolase